MKSGGRVKLNWRLSKTSQNITVQYIARCNGLLLYVEVMAIHGLWQVFWLDTENSFSPSRLLEMLERQMGARNLGV